MADSSLKMWYLKNMALFKGADMSAMKALDDMSVMKKYDKKEYVYFSAEDSDKVYVVKEGHVEIGYLDESGKEFSIDVMGPTEIFGTVLGKGSSGGYARVLSRALICSINRTDFEEFLQKYPAMSFRVLKFLGFKINVLENKLQNLVFKDIRTRICDLLYSLYEKSGDQKRSIIKIPLTHKDIANLVGCTRETASLNLSELKKEGVIEYEKRKIKILSLPRLKQYSMSPS